MRFDLSLDHLAVVCRSLDEGTSYVEAVLGAKMSPGGKHPHMGTHNTLVSLGPGAYLEVIAIDPDAPAPGFPRWFDLDSYNGPPRIMNWICATDDLDTALDAAPDGSGEPMGLARGDMSWAMAVPVDGKLPFDGAMPALIEWETEMHPNKRLPDHGLRLARLDVFHPKAEALLAAFPALYSLPQVSVLPGPEKRLIASVSTPEGMRVIA